MRKTVNKKCILWCGALNVAKRLMRKSACDAEASYVLDGLIILVALSTISFLHYARSVMPLICIVSCRAEGVYLAA